MNNCFLQRHYRGFNFVKYLMLLFVFSSVFKVNAEMQQDTLKIGIYDSPPFVIFNEDGKLDGVSIWLWDRMEKELKVPFKYIRYTEGEQLKTMLEDLKNGHIDMSINPLTITSSRDQYIDFTHPFYIGKLAVVENSKSKLSKIKPIFGDIFNYKILYLVLILGLMVLLFGLIIWLVEKRNNHFERGIQGLISSFWWSAVTMTTVGYGDKVPISNAGRFVAAIWMLFSIVIISIFTASITSNLTVNKLANANLSVHEFREARTGTVKASATETYLKRNFFRDIRSYPEFKTGLHDLKNLQLDLFIYDEPWLLYQIQNNDDFKDLKILPIKFDLQLYAMPMKETLDDDLKHDITAALLKFKETKDWEMLLEEYQLDQY